MTPIDYYIKNHVDSKPDIIVIEMAVCEAMGITRKMLRSTTRKRPIPMARFLCFKFAKIHNLYGSLQKLADRYGKDHASVLHGFREINNRVDTDKEFASMYNKLLFELR